MCMCVNDAVAGSVRSSPVCCIEWHLSYPPLMMWDLEPLYVWQAQTVKLYSTRAWLLHYSDFIMSAMASQITSLTIVTLTVYSGGDQRKHQSSASLAFVRGIHRWPVNSPHKWPVTRKCFPFDDAILCVSGSTNTVEPPEQFLAGQTTQFGCKVIGTNCLALWHGASWLPILLNST